MRTQCTQVPPRNLSRCYTLIVLLYFSMGYVLYDYVIKANEGNIYQADAAALEAMMEDDPFLDDLDMDDFDVPHTGSLQPNRSVLSQMFNLHML